MADIALPWYKSRIIQGLLTVFVTQVVKHVTDHYHIDLTVWGTAVPDIVNGTMDGIGFVALAWAGHARVSPKVPIPNVVTLTQNKADNINSGQVPPPEAKS